MADYEMETFDGGSGAGDAHSKTRTEVDDGRARQQAAKPQEAEASDNSYGAGTGGKQVSWVSPPHAQRASEREAEDTRTVNSAERIQMDDGRAHMVRQTVRHDPRSDSIRSVDIALPRQKLASTPSTIPSVSSEAEIAQSGAGDPTESTDNDAETLSTTAQVTVPVATGRPHISLCQAVQDGKIEIVGQWLEYNKNQPSRNHYSDKHGLYPIHYAAKFNQLQIMELLCGEDAKEGIADVCATTTTEGYTPLHLAARYNPYNLYESAAREDTDSDSGQITPGNYSDYTLRFRRRQSSEAAMTFLISITKVDVNAEDRYGITPLHLACQVGNVEGVNVLLNDKRERIKLDAKDGNGDTPLHEACFHGKEMITEMLLEKMKKTDKLDLTVKNDLGLTPFHLACREGHLNIANRLLHSTNDPSKLVKAKDNEGATPLHLACQNDNNELVSILLKHKADVFARTNYGVTPVHVAAQHGCLKVMHAFLHDPQYIKKGVVNITDDYNQTPLHFSAENGRDEMTKLLLEEGAKKEAVDIDHYTPLLTAAEFGRRSCFKVLLEHDADIEVQNKDRKNAVFLAAESNHPEILEDIILLRKGNEGKKLLSTPDTLLNTPLHIAAEKGNLETLCKLLECREVKTCAKNVLGKTAMHLAAENGHLRIITELELFCPETAKSTDENGDTPLHLACSYGFMEVAERLIKGGADIEARNAVRRTPIGCAAFYGHARVIELLVSSKANIDTNDKLKTTPLQLAAKEGHVIAVETLLKHQASMTSLDQRKFNALDWAIENGHSDVAEAIVKSLKWKSALANYTRTQDGEITSPFRKLIQRMPDVAEMVLNKCTDTNADRSIRPDSEEFAVTFHYQFLEDRDQAELWKEEADAEKQLEEQQKKEKKWFRSQKLKHPMRVMVDSKRTQLLKHPLVYKLIEDKWNRYGRCLFYTGLIFHVAFVIFLMAFSLTLLNPFSPTCVVVSSGRFGLTQPGDEVPLNVSQLQAPHDNITTSYLTDMNITVIDGIAIIDGHVLCFNISTEVRDAVSTVLSVEPICGQCGLSSSEMMFLEAAAVLIILYSITQLFIEALYFSQQLYLYFFDIATWVNVPLYILAIAFVSVFGRECLCPLEGQWQVGIAAMFLVWAHLILNMRRMRVLDTGIYILMFKNIFIRFLKLTILTVLLLLMFALTFYMTFRQFHSLFANSPFATPGHSILKTIAMSIGDLGYDELFRQPTGGSPNIVPGIPFPEISYILWIMFIILIPILFSNLLVGLAVDDIKGILEAAALTRLALRVELVLSLEDRFHFLRHFNCFRDKVYVSKLTIQPHKDLISSKLLSPVIRLLRGENYTSAEHISHVLNPTKTPIEQQTQTLMREISKIQETLKEIPKMQEALCKLLNQAAESKPSSRSRVVPN